MDVYSPHSSLLICQVFFLVSWRRKEVFGPCWQSVICLNEDHEDGSPTPSHMHPLLVLPLQELAEPHLSLNE